MFDEKLETLMQDLLDNGVKIEKKGKNIIVNPNLFNTLLEHLQSNESIVENFENCMINKGCGSSSISIHSLGRWLITYSLQHNIEQALKSLNDYIKSSYAPALAVLAVSGIIPREKIQISDDIELIPFDSLPPSHIKEELYPKILQQGLYFISPSVNSYNPPKAALVKRIKLSPKSYKKDKDHTLPREDLSDLFNACLFLTLFSDSTPVPYTSWIELEEQVPCKEILDNEVSFPSYIDLSREDREIIPYHWDKLKPLYEMFMTLSQKDKDHLKIPIQRLNQARRRLSCVDKAIDQGIAMEALFLNDKSGSEQISFLLRLRASLWLGSDIEEREKLLHFFSAAYTCRSKAVHNGKLAQEIRVSHRGNIHINDLLQESDQLCVDAIKKIINYGGFPDWNKLVLNG